MAPKRLTRADKRDRTRERLLAAAGRVIARDGFQGASVTKITSEAGLSRGALYSNFSSKEALFAELLQGQIYSLYGAMVVERLDLRDRLPTWQETREQLPAIQSGIDGQRMFSLLLELLAAAGRDKQFKRIAARFWSDNRTVTTQVLEAVERPKPLLPAPAEHVAAALIALDVGLAIQHFVDPEAVPLELYPELFELLFRPLRQPGWRPAQRADKPPSQPNPTRLTDADPGRQVGRRHLTRTSPRQES
jgi:AcrR family transcriptional regulator